MKVKFLPQAKGKQKPSAKGQSSLQDFEEGLRSRPYLLVYFQPEPFWQIIRTSPDQFHTGQQSQCKGEKLPCEPN